MVTQEYHCECVVMVTQAYTQGYQCVFMVTGISVRVVMVTQEYQCECVAWLHRNISVSVLSWLHRDISVCCHGNIGISM